MPVQIVEQFPASLASGSGQTLLPIGLTLLRTVACVADGSLMSNLIRAANDPAGRGGCVVHALKYTTIILYMQGQNVSYFEAFARRTDGSIMRAPAIPLGALGLCAPVVWT